MSGLIKDLKMHSLTKADLVVLFGSIALIIIASRLSGNFCQKVNIPSVVGELLTGVLLGPTIMGSFCPVFVNTLFPNTGNLAFAFDAIFNISIMMLLLAAGLEIDIAQVIKNKKSTLYTSILGISIPFVLGFSLVYLFPNLTLSNASNQGIGSTASFVGIALSISALPVLARILSELNLFNNYIGITIMSVAFVTDIVAWLVFSLIISLHKHTGIYSSTITFLIFVAFTTFMLTKGSFIFEKLISTKIKKQGSKLTALLGIGFCCAFFTEYLGFHASIGAFIAGISLHKVIQGESIQREINNFVNSFFAPIFFVSVGLKINFLYSFNLALIMAVILLAFTTKIVGASLGAYLSGITLKPALAIGFGLNVRGSIEIILCTIAFNNGLISKSMFVAFVMMAIATSLICGPIMQKLLRKEASKDILII